MDKFEDLQAFVAVVEAGTFTAAADRLNIAKSAVSRRVSALEERLGVQLLRRTTRVLNLTDTGHSFYEHSARILADLDEAEAAVQQEHGELSGTLRVALPLSFGPGAITPSTEMAVSVIRRADKLVPSRSQSSNWIV